ncbi:MAG: hypothetical protein MUD12_15525 [Spirochaetes bacterium]|jgi:hypothetical protein|nr:hypothetical protein [Spirochaetota bacterium]
MVKPGIIFSLSVIAALLAGCGSMNFSISEPKGFARYKKDTAVFRAISSSGIRMKACRVKNDPYGDADMWSRSVELHLKGLGYHEISRSGLSAASGQKGELREYAYRFNGENYVYSLALFVTKKEIFIIEAAGIEAEFKKRRADIRKSIDGFAISD